MSSYDHDTLGNRMKEYEKAQSISVTRRTPVIIRLDGKAFHTFTKVFDKIDPSLKTSPFSDVMHEAMTYTATQLCANIQNCQIAYTQSDEITLLLCDWALHETEQWFGGNVQKITSVSASIATAAFNKALITALGVDVVPFAMFDSRVFTLPKEEVVNNFIWRQQDASRNSVQMLARFYFSHKQLHGKNNSAIQDMLMEEHGVNWNDISTWKKRGTCILRGAGGAWMTDEEIPIFSQDRTYVEKLLLLEKS